MGRGVGRSRTPQLLLRFPLPVKAGIEDGASLNLLLGKESFRLGILIHLPSSLQFSIATVAGLDGETGGCGRRLLVLGLLAYFPLPWRRPLLLLLRRGLL